MIALPDSPGLRATLPDWTESGDLIRKEDVTDYEVPLEFPLDPLTEEPKPTNVYVAVVAPGFDVDQATRSVRVSPTYDSGIVTFFLTPQMAQQDARVVVELYKEEARSTLIGSMPLLTEVRDEPGGIAQRVWRLVSFAVTAGQKAAASPSGPRGLDLPGNVDFTLRSGRGVDTGLEGVQVDRGPILGNRGVTGRDSSVDSVRFPSPHPEPAEPEDWGPGATDENDQRALVFDSLRRKITALLDESDLDEEEITLLWEQLVAEAMRGDDEADPAPVTHSLNRFMELAPDMGTLIAGVVASMAAAASVRDAAKKVMP
jgi:hypothetical protein